MISFIVSVLTASYIQSPKTCFCMQLTASWPVCMQCLFERKSGRILDSPFYKIVTTYSGDLLSTPWLNDNMLLVSFLIGLNWPWDKISWFFWILLCMALLVLFVAMFFFVSFIAKEIMALLVEIYRSLWPFCYWLFYVLLAGHLRATVAPSLIEIFNFFKRRENI